MHVVHLLTVTVCITNHDNHGIYCQFGIAIIHITRKIFLKYLMKTMPSVISEGTVQTLPPVPNTSGKAENN